MSTSPSPDVSGCWSKAGVGCLTLFAGTVSGGMVGVLISKVVAFVTRAPSCPGIPTCDWHVYALAGMLIGGVTLFGLAMWRLNARRPGDDRTNGHSDRG